MRRAAALFAALLAGMMATKAAAACQPLAHEGRSYTVCEARAGEDDLRLWLNDESGMPYGSFERLDAAVTAAGLRIVFAMNAGMYHPDRSPVGLYVEDGAQAMRLITSQGPGNFGMLPNGVFCIGADSFAVVESRRFAEAAHACRHATQSGPMLVIDEALHPRFIDGSTSRLLRNGVGVSPDGRTAYFAISEEGVNFHEFARLFRDRLGTPQALYFDGNVSRLHAPHLGRSDPGRPMGPIIGMVVPAG